MVTITVPCVQHNVFTVPPGPFSVQITLNDNHDPDEYIRKTPDLVLEQLNYIRQQMGLTNDDYHQRHYPNRHELYNIYWLERYNDESLRDYLYSFCELQNRKSYTEWIYKQFIRDFDDIKDIIHKQKRLFQMKEYNQFNDFDDNIEYIQKCVNFLCTFVYEYDYSRYKLTKDDREHISLIDSDDE